MVGVCFLEEIVIESVHSGYTFKVSQEADASAES